MRRICLAMVAAVLCLGALGSSSRSAPAPASEGFIVDTWGAKQGLPQSSILSMILARDGYLWLGTLNGLVRFDGIRFTVFDEANTPGLNSSRIVHVFEDSRSNLWVGTESAGVLLVEEGQVKKVDFGSGAREKRLVSACEDTSGAVWLYTGDGQLCRYLNGHADVWNTGEEGQNRYRAVIQEVNGPLWVGTDWGQGSINPQISSAPTLPLLDKVIRAGSRLDLLLPGKNGGYWQLADGHIQFWRGDHPERDLGNYPWSSETPPITACEDAEGNLIVGTFGDGVYWFGPDGHAQHIPVVELPGKAFVSSLCLDHEGSLWVGTDGQDLYRIRRSPVHVLPETQGRVVQSVAEDQTAGLWIGYNNGGAAYIKEGHAQAFGAAEGLYNRDVWSVFVDKDDHVWAGTWGTWGLFRKVNSSFELVNGKTALQGAVLAIHQDAAGRLWFGTQNGLVCLEGSSWNIYTANNGLASDVIRAITSDRAGNVWVGTMGGGLNQIHEGHISSFHKSPDALPSDNVSSLYADADGVLWVGTFGSGLARFENGKWTHFTTRDGLASNGIGYLIEDGEGYLWIGSNSGLMRIAKAQLNAFARGQADAFHCQTYTEADGLPTRECTQGSEPGACRAHDGTLWFPTTRGLVAIKPADLRPNTNPPPVLIESVLIDGQSQGRNGLRTSIAKRIAIPPHRERLEIQYTSLNLSAPQRARFKYRMAGHETEWVEAGNSRLARYSKLPPGEYHFEVMACNEDGVWGPVDSSLAVIVEPPFWRTLWFISLLAILLVGTIVTTVYLISTQKLQRRLKQQEALEKDRSRIARDLHDQLGASLTQVALLGEMVEGDKNQPAEVETHGRQISQTARETTHVLDEIVWAVNPQNDTLDSLVTYVCKYAQDYLAVADLRYRLDVPANLPTTPLKPEIRHNVFLAAKEAVTNIVKHAQAKSVWLRLRLEPGQFTFEIEDDGRGPGDLTKPSTRNGLQNMRKRMEDAGGVFTIGPAAERGTIVRLTAPLDR